MKVWMLFISREWCHIIIHLCEKASINSAYFMCFHFATQQLYVEYCFWMYSMVWWRSSLRLPQPSHYASITAWIFADSPATISTKLLWVVFAQNSNKIDHLEKKMFWPFERELWMSPDSLQHFVSCHHHTYNWWSTFLSIVPSHCIWMSPHYMQKNSSATETLCLPVVDCYNWCPFEKDRHSIWLRLWKPNCMGLWLIDYECFGKMKDHTWLLQCCIMPIWELEKVQWCLVLNIFARCFQLFKKTLEAWSNGRLDIRFKQKKEVVR